MYVIYKKLPKVKNHTIAKMALGYFVDGGFFPGHFLSGDFAHLGLNLNLTINIFKKLRSYYYVL
jgi:hypothetical protein